MIILNLILKINLKITINKIYGDIMIKNFKQGFINFSEKLKNISDEEFFEELEELGINFEYDFDNKTWLIIKTINKGRY